jgi:N-acetylglutamate synthase-like GNAT family acetyltransferase
MNGIEVSRLSPDFDDWKALHGLLVSAFASMDGRIDPPSSLTRMSVGDLQKKALTEFVVIARERHRLVGCGFGAASSDCLYLSKLAVDADFQKRGVLRSMLPLFVSEARGIGLNCLELKTRVELTDNHATFAALGFEKVGETAHPSYDRPTSFTFRKSV